MFAIARLHFTGHTSPVLAASHPRVRHFPRPNLLQILAESPDVATRHGARKHDVAIVNEANQLFRVVPADQTKFQLALNNVMSVVQIGPESAKLAAVFRNEWWFAVRVRGHYQSSKPPDRQSLLGAAV